MNGAALVAAYRDRFKTPPYQHQLADVASLLEHEYFGLFLEMGTGKSKIVIDAACIMREEQVIDTVLVISPAAVRSVWVQPEFGQLKQHAWLPSRVWEFHQPTKIVWSDRGPRLDWVVTNYEFVRNVEHRERLLNLLHGRQVLMVLDESSYVKSRAAIQTKACEKLGAVVKRKVILNGTPIANTPLDLWSQAHFLDKRILPYKNFIHFRSEFAVLGGWHNKQVLSWKNLERLQAHLAPHVTRRLKTECLDLPPKIYNTVEVSLSNDTWQLYKQMRDEAVVWLGENPTLAAQAGVRIMRLAQITSGFLGGFVGNLEDETRWGDFAQPTEVIGSEKLDWLRTWLVERLESKPNQRLVVWCRFRPELERVAENLKDVLPTFRFYGQGQKERAVTTREFSKLADLSKPALLAGQPQAGGLGQDFTVADVEIYLSNDRSLMYRLQSEDRLHRGGQTRPVYIMDVLATGPKGQKTIDHVIVKALREKNDLAAWTCNAWRRALEEE